MGSWSCSAGPRRPRTWSYRRRGTRSPCCAGTLDLTALADGGYDGAGIGVFTPVKQPTDGRALHVDNRTYNALLRGLRCLGERGFALVTGRRRALRHFATRPRKIGSTVKAALTLTHFEHRRLT
ncbi:transposase family protein [Saccharothrix deserti]|uniref:transposase family protein n=1 Tax=Saccharothrix deserti TaxID=2593674 RepID=UPI001EE3F943|nr:transposase family protein [Saccharothrix deserti]